MKKQIKNKLLWLTFLAFAITVATVVPSMQRRLARADEIQPLIDAVVLQIAENQALVNQKRAESDTLMNYLKVAQADLAVSKSSLQLTRLQLIQAKQRLEVNKKVLTEQQGLLGENIAVLYKNGNITPMEVLASSDNLSDFVGRQEYYASMRRKIDGNLKAIQLAKKQLDDLRGSLTQRESEEQLNLAAITRKEANITEMLERTQGDERIYQALVNGDKAKLDTLRAQQSAAIAAQSSGRTYELTSDYPWASAEPFPNPGVDPWGFYYRQCTSYAAWRRAQIGKPIPAWGFMGPANAKEWPKWAKSSNMTVDTTPEVGALAVYPAGEYGHVMVVEGIVGNGHVVLVSEYNASWDGRYSQSLWPASSLVFIH